MVEDKEMTREEFENLGASAKSSLRQFYILKRLEEMNHGLDDFYTKQLKGIRTFHPEFNTEMIPDCEKVSLNKQVSQMISSMRMKRAK